MSATNQPNPLRVCELKMALAVLELFRDDERVSLQYDDYWNHYILRIGDNWADLDGFIFMELNLRTEAAGEGYAKRGPWLADAILKVKGELNDAKAED